MNLPDPFGPKHVSRVLEQLGLEGSVHHFESATATAEQAATAVGCELGEIAKSICVMASARPVLVVASGDRRVDDAKLAKLLEVGRKKIKFAKLEECIIHFGYTPGGVAPVGHRRDDIPVYIDESLGRFEVVWAAAGTPHDNFPVRFDELVRVTSGTVADCTRSQPPTME